MPRTYKRSCNGCNNYYEGVGQSFCSTKCVIRKLHSEETKIKLSKTWFKKGHKNLSPNSLSLWITNGGIPWNKGLKGFRAGKGTRPNSIPKGELHWNYIEDRTKLKKDNTRNDYAYQNWRKQVWLRDNFKCKMANENCKGKIEAHHILAWRNYPELRYQPNNGITLCHAHHPRKREEEAELSSYFQQLVAEMN